jgi:hypothetical protein
LTFLNPFRPADLLKSNTESLIKLVLRLAPVFLLGLLVGVQTCAQSSPAIVSTRGYINGTPLTSHTSTAFNSVGASTLVAFVSTNTPWNGQPVSISGLSDSAGNSWSVLAGPTTWAGNSFTLVSAIYYVNAPITSASETVTVNLSNPAPLVFHVFAVSGADITGPPISSAITNPGVGGTSASVTTAPIAVPADSLLLSWVKNETSATATALDGYTLDAQQSTSFLWAESEAPLSAGSYSGQFQYDSAIGWQTAIVGLKPLTGPEAASQAVTTKFNTPVNITLTGISPQGFPLTYSVATGPGVGTLSGTPPNLTYTPATGYVGHDAFTFKVNDGTTDSNTATVSISVQGPVAFVSSIGYINSTPLTTHTSAAFNSVGSSTLVAFVSSHPSWNGLPVSINGLSDSAGNTWSVVAGPTAWAGSSFTLLSEIYYVNSPIISSTETVTVNLSNPAPLVLHVFAVAGADITGVPIFSAITSPAVGGASASVMTAPIAVPTNSLLMSWVKNENSATATALGGYTLDAQQSTTFLWAEYETALSAGNYTGQFQYDSAIGWQTAVVGLKPPGSVVQPVLTATPANPTNQTGASFNFTDTQTGVSFLCQLNGSGFSGCTSPASYSGLSQGSHTFSVLAVDTANNQSAAANFTWTISTTPPTTPTITSTPANPSSSASAAFSFTDTQTGVSFLCQLDGSAFSACTSPANYSSLGQGSHTFSVEAQDTAGNQSAPASFTWTINTTPPPTPTFTSTPANPTNQTSASFSFTDTQAGVSFLCQLDGSVFSACTSPPGYSGLTVGIHTFSVKAQDTTGNQSAAATFTWTISTTPPLAPTITSTPANPSSAASASFSFTDTQTGVIFLCQLDGSVFSACTSPASYSGLSKGSHTFSVMAQDAAGNQSAAVSFTWTIGAVNIVSSVGYINSTPLATHTSAVFNSVGSSTLVAFVSSHPSWNGLPVSITGLSDSAGNTWSVVTGPATWAGNSFTLLSSLYYVNSPITSASETVTANLSNPAPLVLHVFAVSGADITGVPIFSAITNPGVGGTSAGVVTAPIAAPTNSLLLSWVKNETSASATALGGYTLDAQQSTTFLWAEYETALSAGNYTGQFQYDSAIGWQTAIVGLKPPGSVVQPVLTATPANPTNQTAASFSFTDTQTGVSFLCQLDGSGFSACSSPASYSGLSQGSHAFSVLAQDTSNNQSAAASFTWTINTTPPPTPTLTSTPANPTNQTGASFSFTDTQGGVNFFCQLDGSTFNTCTSPTAYAGLIQGSHTFSVKAQDSAGNQSAPAGFTWTINTTPPPAPAFTATPANPTNQTTASFSFTNTQAGVSFLCQLDGSTFSVCTSPAAYAGLIQGSHTFSVKALDTAGNQSTAASFTWTINTTPPPTPTITAKPANPTNQTSASFSFTDAQTGVSFLCQLDGSAFSACTSPKTYAGLSLASHTFSVKAQDTAGNQSIAASFTWTIQAVIIAFGQVAAATPQSPAATVSVTFPRAQSAGDLNIVVVGSNDTSSSVQLVSDSAGNTYNLAIGPTIGAALQQSIYYASNIVGGSNTVTVTFNQAAAFPDVRILEYSGVTTLDVKAGATGNSTAANSGAATTTSAYELIFGADMVATVTKAAGSGFTSRIITAPDGDIAEDKIVTTAGSNSATATLGSAGPWVMQMVTFSSSPGPAPTVSSVSPNTGSTAGGTVVTITGTNFVTGATVTFGGTLATNVTVVLGTQITATTPAGSAGAVAVTVTNPGGQNGSLSNGFTYIAPPTITNVSPNNGPTAGGTSVTITGTNFAAGATLTFGTAAATNVVVVSATQITATTPAGTAGAATVKVTNPSGLIGSLTNGFTYGPPTVSSVSPNNGAAAGGTAVTITGTRFVAGATVSFGTTAATNVVVVSATQITATSPAGTAGAVTVTVTNPGGLSGSLTNGFTYGAPTVSSVAPNTGSIGGGTAVTITGTNFAAGATVTFGTTAATGVVVASATKITATTPASVLGAVTVTVTNPGGQSGSLTNGFTYAVFPTVSSLSPNSGAAAGGTTVTITGTNFVAGATVTFGSSAATNIVVVNGTQITATTPPGSVGAVAVTVTIPGGQSGSLPNGFTYQSAVGISFGQVAAATPQSPTVTVAATFPGAQTAGNLNIVVVGWNDTTSAVTSVKDSAGNIYTLAIGPTSGTALQQSIYYASNIVGGSNKVTVTFNQAAAYPDLRILEYHGVTTLDAKVGASGNSATTNSGSATTTNANELIIGANTVFTFTGAAGTGFTSRIITSDGDIAEDKVVTTAGSNSANATLSSAGPWVMQMVTFK